MEIDGNIYWRLVIEATSPEMDIWLGDDEGHLVQKETGKLDTSVMEGQYTVEFGLGNTTCPIHLIADAGCTEAQIKAGLSCPRPIPKIEATLTDDPEGS